MRHLDVESLRAALPMTAAIDALAAGVGVQRDDPLRSRVATDAGELLVMPASGPEGAGVKLAGIVPANAERGLPVIQGLYVLLDGATLAPVATIDGAALTVLRTAALSGLATRHLAREDAARVVVFGTGPQAVGHAEAMCAVRPVESIAVVGRDQGRAEAAADAIRTGVLGATTSPAGDRGASTEPPRSPGATTSAGSDRGASAAPPAVTATTDARAALEGADVVCTCTAATAPLFASADLPDGVHVNALGSHRAQDRELDEATVVRARVVVEGREPAWAEAGELALALEAGAIGRDHVVADLAELVAGAAVRRSAADVTLFKAVGAAFEDLIVAAAAVEAA